MFIWECIDNSTINNAEHDRRRADAESQGEDGHERETTIFAEVAEGVAEIAGETIEVGFHTSKLYTEAAANCRGLTIDQKGSYSGRAALYSMPANALTGQPTGYSD
jgi:hypothetical protein